MTNHNPNATHNGGPVVMVRKMAVRIVSNDSRLGICHARLGTPETNANVVFRGPAARKAEEMRAKANSTKYGSSRI